MLIVDEIGLARADPTGRPSIYDATELVAADTARIFSEGIGRHCRETRQYPPLGRSTGATWADIPERYGPHTTCVNRFNRWRKAGVWDRLLEAVSKAYDGDIQMIDSSSIRVHQHAIDQLAKSDPGMGSRR
jgi:Putative transposase of IS4/5 family (DUF4096)